MSSYLIHDNPLESQGFQINGDSADNSRLRHPNANRATINNFEKDLGIRGKEHDPSYDIFRYQFHWIMLVHPQNLAWLTISSIIRMWCENVIVLMMEKWDVRTWGWCSLLYRRLGLRRWVCVMRVQKWDVRIDCLEFSHNLLLQVPESWPIAELSLFRSPFPNSVIALWRKEGGSFI
jgi:hypothetical protein